ncbi:MAG: PDZ domain-containing protein [Nitrospirae bacterium]|nr:PDZ domain-containing protein [Nitrospirota bacterium]
MRINLLLCSLLMGLILSSCAQMQVHEIERTDNNIKGYRLMLVSEDTPENKLMVKSVAYGGPADKAGVKAGDIILSVDGNKITSKEFSLLLTHKQKGEHVKLVVERNNRIINFDMEPGELSNPPDYDKILHILGDKKRVVLAIIIGQIKNTMPNIDAPLLEAWETAMRSSLQKRIETFFLTADNNDSTDPVNNLSIVDSSRLETILDGYSLSRSGPVSDRLRATIGLLTGATHLVLVDFGRFQYQNIRGAYTDVVKRTLIDVATGEVLAVATLKITMGR